MRTRGVGIASPWWECTIWTGMGHRQEGVVVAVGVWRAHPHRRAWSPQHLWFSQAAILPPCTPSAPNAPTHHSRENLYFICKYKCDFWFYFYWPPCAWFPQGPGLRSKKHPLWATCVWVKDLLDPWRRHKIKLLVHRVAARWRQNATSIPKPDPFIFR